MRFDHGQESAESHRHIADSGDVRLRHGQRVFLHDPVCDRSTGIVCRRCGTQQLWVGQEFPLISGPASPNE